MLRSPPGSGRGDLVGQEGGMCCRRPSHHPACPFANMNLAPWEALFLVGIVRRLGWDVVAVPGQLLSTPLLELS